MMTPLWLAMAGVTLVAVVCLLWPILFYRQAQPQAQSAPLEDQLAENVALFREHLAEQEQALNAGMISAEQFAQLKLELERSLLEDEQALRAANKSLKLNFGPRGLVLVTGLIVIASVVFYWRLGASQDVYIQRLQQQKLELDHADLLAGREPDPARVQALGQRMAQRLERTDNLQYWFLLARNAMEQGDFEQAVNAYREVLARDPNSARVMAELAQALFLRDDNRMSPAIAELAQTALGMDPHNTTALGLAGIHAFEARDYQSAIHYWERTLRLVDPRSAGARSLQSSVARARQLLAAQGDAPEALAAGGAQIRFQLSLAEQVQAQPEQLVFVYARAWEGSPMPLAITRLRVADLPLTLTLDDSMAMSAMASLSQAQQVELVARISAQGEASAQPGDWQGTLGPIDLTNQPDAIHLEIDHQVAAP